MGLEYGISGESKPQEDSKAYAQSQALGNDREDGVNPQRQNTHFDGITLFGSQHEAVTASHCPFIRQSALIFTNFVRHEKMYPSYSRYNV